MGRWPSNILVAADPSRLSNVDSKQQKCDDCQILHSSRGVNRVVPGAPLFVESYLREECATIPVLSDSWYCDLRSYQSIPKRGYKYGQKMKINDPKSRIYRFKIYSPS
ncbi:hypothetical protein GYMLUDRAFT_73758 [Collybiopsis luxurians FD-317 M1]|uniref:Uncharacterized protein n=1 Tax=Collybiopsis luxurians FD-317 M1 TaxID=944289 RepID=A0A0D0B9G6_9AGAR|nr:hypothetical protein GYMLUDRAFT_73758 [Collybiopsis luxurians FD-317 M1]